MIGLYYNNNLDVLMIRVQATNDVNFSKQDDLVTIYSKEQLIGYNILNFSNYYKCQEVGMLIKEKLPIIKLINQKFKLDLLEDKGSNIQVARIIEVKKHPKSDHLSILNVEFEKQILPVVTNIENIQEGSYGVFALPFAFLPDGSQVKPGKIIDVLSSAMAVSLKTLKIADISGLINMESEDFGKDYLMEVIINEGI